MGRAGVPDLDVSKIDVFLGEGYGIAVGRPANLVVLDAESDYEAVRRQAKARVSIRAGKVLMTRVPEQVEFT